MLRRALLVVAAAGLAGCGGTDSKPERTPQTAGAVMACLDRDDAYDSVERLAIEGASPGADAAIELKSGGPEEHDGTIIEAPVVVDRVYLFADEAAAVDAAAGAPKRLEAKQVGRAAVYRHSFGIGDRPETVPLTPEALAPIATCLKASGYA